MFTIEIMFDRLKRNLMLESRMLCHFIQSDILIIPLTHGHNKSMSSSMLMASKDPSSPGVPKETPDETKFAI